MVSKRRNTRVARAGVGGAVAVLAAVLSAATTAAPAGSDPRSGPRRTYIVELATSPLPVSDGSIKALEAGRIRRFEALVDGSERRALASARARRAPVLHRYRTAFAGFAARLTAGQAERLARAGTVAAVTPETVYRPLAEPVTPHSSGGPLSGGSSGQNPAFVGLPAGIWTRAGGPARAGEGVTIGVIDTGIHPEHPSFADTPIGPDGVRRYDGPAYSAPAGWKGACQTGDDFPASACNNKLIGARFFVDGFKARNVHHREHLSPRDVSGHGTHVAATGAGNYGVQPVVGGHGKGASAVSGIAPRARIAVYKICWTGRAANGGAPGTCMASDAVAAIDAAVADGVDVINYSVGSTAASVFGPVERAFLGAAAAGVFVANAAGNSGPEAGTLGSPNGVPWVTSVAATTVAVGAPAPLRLGDGHPVGVPGDRVAAFSSRGPGRAAPDIAKPDLAAPGVNILAADAPARTAGGRAKAAFRTRSGTSMASPEVAGAAALLMQLEPDWSPAAIKSALMTSAEPAVLAEDGRHLAGPLAVGSGRVEPNRAATTGLVLDVAVSDYLGYLKGQIPEKVFDTGVTPLEPVDLNLPSVALSRFGHSASTVRRFTSVDRFRQRWMVTLEAPSGVAVFATPDRFDILPGATQDVRLSFRFAGAAAGAWTSGALVLVNETDGRRVRLPVSVQPVQ